MLESNETKPVRRRRATNKADKDESIVDNTLASDISSDIAEASPAAKPAKRSRARKVVAPIKAENQTANNHAEKKQVAANIARATELSDPIIVTAELEPKRRDRAKAPVAPEAIFSAAVAEPKVPSLRRSVKAKDKETRVPSPDFTKELETSLAKLAQEKEEKQVLRPDLANPFAIHFPDPQEKKQVLAGIVGALADDEEEDDEPRRRLRKRGGRRRRNREDDEEASELEANTEDAVKTDSRKATDDSLVASAKAGQRDSSDNSETQEDDAEEASEGIRRRRRRRRRGEEYDAGDDEDVIVTTRERRNLAVENAPAEVTDIEGSTRMEAKRQRRREGRATTRRRAPILTEAEFLARRESVDRKMLIQESAEYTQIAVLEDGVLVEHYVDLAEAVSLIGSIYLGKVQNVLPSMEAAFVDIGRGRNAVLYAGEIDWESYGAVGEDRKVEKVFKPGDSVLVQVTKDPVGAKGARLTSHISIPGRYIVYSPGGQLSGISRKLPDVERNRLKALLDDIIGEEASVIVRTAAEGASEEELVRDANRLKAQWEVIQKKAKAKKAPHLLYSEPDLTVRIIRDLFTEDFNKLIVASKDKADTAFETVSAYVSHVVPALANRVERWEKDQELFEHYRLNEQLQKALERKVFLPSGGSLVIDRTEAMTVIDVNTGKFTGNKGNLEATVTSNNLEAAEEIVRQLRLRDIGGIIVIDFIDMVLPANRELLLRRLVECLGRDRTRHQVAEVTSLGLVQMTRKKIGAGLAEAFTRPCATCDGRGYHPQERPIADQVASDGGARAERRNNRNGQHGQNGRGLVAEENSESAKPIVALGKTKSARTKPEKSRSRNQDELSEAVTQELETSGKLRSERNPELQLSTATNPAELVEKPSGRRIRQRRRKADSDIS